jgi:RNA polymerase sigma-54 factor
MTKRPMAKEADTDYTERTSAAAGTENDDSNDDTSEWADGGGTAESPIDFFQQQPGSKNSSTATRDDGDFEPQNAAPETLQQHLLWQLNMASFNPRQHVIATVLIDATECRRLSHGRPGNPADRLPDG